MDGSDKDEDHEQQRHHYHQQDLSQQEMPLQATTGGQHYHQHATYSIYEPHFQQMHPLLYYEEPQSQRLEHQNPNESSSNNGNEVGEHDQLNQHAMSHHILSPLTSSLGNGQHHHHNHHPWDQEHFVHMPLISFGDTSHERAESLEYALAATGGMPFESSHEELADSASSELVRGQSILDDRSEHNSNFHEPYELTEGPIKVEEIKNWAIKSEAKQIDDTKEREEDDGDQLNLCKDQDGPIDLKENSAQIESNGLCPSRDNNSTGVESRGLCDNHSQQPATPLRSDMSGELGLGPTNRELHNEIERRRRYRIKHCCDILRTIVPGLSDKTDKATVLEYTVKFVSHLSNCPSFDCTCQY